MCPDCHRGFDCPEDERPCECPYCGYTEEEDDDDPDA